MLEIKERMKEFEDIDVIHEKGTLNHHAQSVVKFSLSLNFGHV